MHILHKIYTLTTAAALCLSTLSCSHDKDEPGNTLPGTMAIAIAVQGATRADGQAADFETGEDLENTINLSNGYRILFFTAGDNSDGGGKYISMFNSSYNSDKVTADSDGSYYYNFIGSLPPALPAKFKILVLANWPAYPSEGTTAAGMLQLRRGVTTIKDVVTHESARFNHLSGSPTWLDDNNLIPFYGVREYDISAINPYAVANGKIKEDAIIDLNKKDYALPLLRAMAKIEVVNTNPLVKAYEAVYIDRVNNAGYCAPFGGSDSWDFNEKDYFNQYVWGTDFTRELHLVGNANDATPVGPLQLRKVTSQNNPLQEKWVAYVPEYRNVGVDDFCSITISDGSKLKNIYFATGGSGSVNSDYKNTSANATRGEPGRYNIERNNIYRFTVTNKVPDDPVTPPDDPITPPDEPEFPDEDAEISVTLDVQPYASIDLSYDFGLMRDEQGDLMIYEGSHFWSQLQAVFGSDSWIPRTGKYDGNGNFDIGNYDDTDNFTKTNNIAIVDKIVYEKDLGDYYAIVLPSNGNIRQSEIWVKDSDGCRVISNFSKNIIDGNDDIVNDQSCSARQVRDFSGNTPVTYYKDRDGFWRLQHNRDHSAIVLTHDKRMYFKVVEEDKTSDTPGTYKIADMLPVESWNKYDATTKTGGDFWYRAKIAPYGETPGSPSNTEGLVEITYKYGNLGGVTPIDADGNAMSPEQIANDESIKDRKVHVRFSELSEQDQADFPYTPIL